MTPAASKILGASLLLFILAAASAWYLWQLEEKRSMEIMEAMVVTAASKNDRTASADTMAAIEKLDSFILPGAGETVDFLSFVEDVARRTGVIIEVTGLEAVKTKTKGFDDLSASFSVTGSRAAVEAVLVVFENLPYHSRVTALSLERNESETRADLSLVLTVRE